MHDQVGVLAAERQAAVTAVAVAAVREEQGGGEGLGRGTGARAPLMFAANELEVPAVASMTIPSVTVPDPWSTTSGLPAKPGWEPPLRKTGWVMLGRAPVSLIVYWPVVGL